MTLPAFVAIPHDHCLICGRTRSFCQQLFDAIKAPGAFVAQRLNDFYTKKG